MKFAQGLASQNLNNYWNRLTGLSGSGQAAASQLAGLGQSYAANVGNQYNNAAAARAGAYYQTANNTTDALASLGMPLAIGIKDETPATLTPLRTQTTTLIRLQGVTPMPMQITVCE
ncbi:hypothetical protein LOK85_12680 [Xylella fastidiosa subsp. multiplex]|uniref:hypothetical protein n=1 Tax=Xylella fastidiosa TaxID=2371 RepID=UPI00234DC5E4|nr:hypothetical protein [Xylella fastidiosa]MDC6416725.1 hypothetical protein [Xylella fastidiosa subsp. multiplex]